MLKKLAAGEMLGESVVEVWAEEKGFGDVRLTLLPGCKFRGSKLESAWIVMPVKLHVHNLSQSADNKDLLSQPVRQFCSGCQIRDDSPYLPNSIVASPVYLW